MSCGDLKPREFDERFMLEAISEARKALELEEVPVGAIIVHDNTIVGRGHNLKESRRDPTCHAEMIAIREAARHLGQWRLSGTTIYVTLEPCPMCAGALVQARVDRVVFGALDPKAGACGSIVNLVQEPRFNHRLEVVAGVLGDECAALLKEFFARLRQEPPAT